MDTLESVNINLQREVEVLQCRVKEQSKSLTRMTGDMEAVEAVKFTSEIIRMK